MPKENQSELQKALNSFSSATAKKEGNLSETSIGNIRETLHVTNSILGGDKLYNEILKWYRKNEGN